MAITKFQLLQRLKELHIEYSQYEHPSVETVEAQAKYVGHLGGGLSKNLFLKDKKHRLYIVSALENTKVDLKVLSQRLGLGKGGLRMAPTEALGEVLQVSLGCVTPFALVNESARNVSLLLDQGFKTREFCFFHPLSNDTSISLNVRELDKFLKSIGINPSYVDLEANPSVGKDQPPDLADLVPSGATVLPDTPEKVSSLQTPAENHNSVDIKATTVKVKDETKVPKPSKAVNDQEKSANAARVLRSFVDPACFVDEVLNKTSALVLSEITEGTIKQHGEQLGTVVSTSLKKRLSSELKNLATILQNTAYTQGFHDGVQSQPKRM